MERYDLMGTPTASSEEAGILRVASEVDEKNCGCKDAAITPSNLYNVLKCRKANTAYKGNEIVACPYHTEFLLKCVQAGTTSTGSLDTTSATLGKVYTDGGVKWEVVLLPIEFGGTGAANAQGARYNLELNLRSYVSLGSLGTVDYINTIAEICEAMPANSRLFFFASASTTSSQYLKNDPTPVGGTVYITKSANTAIPVEVRLVEQGGNGDVYVGRYTTTGNRGFSGWRKLAVQAEVEAVQAEVEAVQAEVSTKANVNALSMPSGNKITLATDLTSYTAPADGWLSISGTSNSNNGIIVLRTANVSINNRCGASGYNRLFIPLAKDETVFIESATHTIDNLVFVYAQSEV